mmetsp:Transcript_27968/g.38667  ORF Transcript_27968/g.38667 Transcript_27968/m.38667 type:complete len:345 (-) Transcript_27968:209-1243(-)
MYVTVLLLSMQFKAALHYLLNDTATLPYRVDAVHVAIALLQRGVLDVSGMEPDDTWTANLDLPGQVAKYGEGVASVNPCAALEYIDFASSCSSSSPMASNWISSLLQVPGAASALLGTAGNEDKSALARFLPHPQARQAILLDAADRCRARARYNEAMELYGRAGESASGLEIVNQLLGDLLGGPNNTTVPQHELNALLRQGAGVLATVQDTPALKQQQAVFEALKTISEVFTAATQGRNLEAVQLLKEVPYIPLESSRVQPCLDHHHHPGSSGSQGHAALSKVIPGLVLTAAQALHRLNQGSNGVGASPTLWKDQLRAITDFGARISMASDLRARLAALAPSM